MFWEIFKELDWTYTTLGAHLMEYVCILFKCFKLRLEPNFDNVPKFLKAANEGIETLQEIFKNLQRQFPDAPNPEWLLPFMLTYIITLEPYEDIAQEFQTKLVQEEWALTMADTRKLLKLIHDKHAHKVGAQTMAEATETLTKGENPTPSLKTAITKSSSHLAKHGLRLFSLTASGWKARNIALTKSSNTYMAGRNRNSVERAEPTKELLQKPNSRTSRT